MQIDSSSSMTHSAKDPSCSPDRGGSNNPGRDQGLLGEQHSSGSLSRMLHNMLSVQNNLRQMFHRLRTAAFNPLSQQQNAPAVLTRTSFFSTKTEPEKTEPEGRPVSDAEVEQIRVMREERVSPATGQPLREIAARVWRHQANVAGAGHRSGLKVLRKPLKGPLYQNWYLMMPHEYKSNPHTKLTEKQERWKRKLKILRAGGKGPPKKGSGKRSK